MTDDHDTATTHTAAQSGGGVVTVQVLDNGDGVGVHALLGVDTYCRRYWLPLVGPTAYLVGVHFAEAGSGTWPTRAVGAAVGVKPSVVRNALQRLLAFGLVQHSDYPDGTTIIGTATHWPSLPPRRAARLHPTIRAAWEVDHE